MSIIPKTEHLKDLPNALRLVCGTDAVVEDVAALQLAAHDIFFQSPQLPQFIVYPRSSASLASAIASIHCAGLALAPRGGGMSYTGGYLPAQAYACIDLSRMNRVVEVNTQDLYITLEAGCTWAQVRDALSGSGYTTPYAGPLSGLRATVGGALSQNSMFFGAGQHGSAAESVLSLSVVLANGELLHTGSAGFSGASPFARWGGPDLTGLFLGDAGAMGIKAQATLRLIPVPAAQGYASFGFPTLADMVGAQIDLMRQGLGSECFGIDAFKAVHSAQTGNKLATGLQTLSQITRSAPDLISGLKSAASLALTGTQYLAVHPYSIHLALDGDSQAHVDGLLARVAQIAVAHLGVAQPASVPTVLRAQPFQPLRSVLGYNGDRWVPVHGIVPLSKAQEVVRSIETLIAAHAAEMQTHNIVYSPLTANLDRAFLFEPCFYWPDEILPIHVDVLGTSLTAVWQQRPPSPAAHALVSQLWTEVTQCLDSFGAVHFQHGRAYPYLQRLQPSTRQLVIALKQALDPHGLMNPGSLGLAAGRLNASEFAASS
ncbi:MAG: FAD-binding oxidoreductase [Betaproteobacteria bacterium]|nr:FAD-binding oxidoreductase [Betaproteobacteria bacterium]